MSDKEKLDLLVKTYKDIKSNEILEEQMKKKWAAKALESTQKRNALAKRWQPMKLFKAVYTRGVHYLLASSQEEAVAITPRYTERDGILKTVFEVEED